VALSAITAATTINANANASTVHEPKSCNKTPYDRHGQQGVDWIFANLSGKRRSVRVKPN